jgi:N-acylglucosamine 2-epimerase
LANPARLARLSDTYRSGLLDDVVSFWTRHAIDSEYGGFSSCLDREGKLIDTDKSVWVQGRMTWLFATLFSEVEPREEWLAYATSGVRFLQQHSFDEDGRMFFHLTREGVPLRKRRYFFSECFAIMGYAAFARASGEEIWKDRAQALYARVVEYVSHPELLPAKHTAARPSLAFSVPMVLLITAQVLHKTMEDPEFGEWYGYLHRDGRISSTLKGNMWKSAFHLPRMQLVSWQILKEELAPHRSAPDASLLRGPAPRARGVETPGKNTGR